MHIAWKQMDNRNKVCIYVSSVRGKGVTLDISRKCEIYRRLPGLDRIMKGEGLETKVKV